MRFLKDCWLGIEALGYVVVMLAMIPVHVAQRWWSDQTD
jgi:hypothetical protein